MAHPSCVNCQIWFISLHFPNKNSFSPLFRLFTGKVIHVSIYLFNWILVGTFTLISYNNLIGGNSGERQYCINPEWKSIYMNIPLRVNNDKRKGYTFNGKRFDRWEKETEMILQNIPHHHTCINSYELIILFN